MKKATVTKKDDKVDVVIDSAVVAERLKKWFPDLSPHTQSALVTYHSELLKATKASSLIPSATIKNAESVHIADAILGSRMMAPALVANEPLYDVGGASGIPSLVFALLYPERKVIAVDRDTRRVEFLKHIASSLKLANLSVVAKGLDELPSGIIKNCVARTNSPFARALLVARKQVGKGGKYFHMKGDGWANELAQMPSQLFSHWTPSLLGQYRLPESMDNLFIVVTEKLAD